MAAGLTPDDQRRKATILGKLAARTLERPPGAVPGHIGPGSHERCHACNGLIGMLEYKVSWAGSRIAVHSGCFEVWSDDP